MSIKRWKWTSFDTGIGPYEDMAEDENGDWVRYEDIKELLDKLFETKDGAYVGPDDYVWWINKQLGCNAPASTKLRNVIPEEWPDLYSTKEAALTSVVLDETNESEETEEERRQRERCEESDNWDSPEMEL